MQCAQQLADSQVRPNLLVVGDLPPATLLRNHHEQLVEPLPPRLTGTGVGWGWGGHMTNTSHNDNYSYSTDSCSSEVT